MSSPDQSPTRDSDSRLLARCLLAAVGGFATYRVGFPHSNGWPMFAAAGIFLATTAWEGYVERSP